MADTSGGADSVDAGPGLKDASRRTSIAREMSERALGLPASVGPQQDAVASGDPQADGAVGQGATAQTAAGAGGAGTIKPSAASRRRERGSTATPSAAGAQDPKDFFKNLLSAGDKQKK